MLIVDRGGEMDIGVCVATSPSSWEVAVEAERLGFNSIWFWDSPLVAGDVLVAMGATAMKTSKIRLGTAVYVPGSRDPSVTASGFATLNALAPGRIDLCAGTGNTARRCYRRPAVTRKQFKEHMEQTVALLAGESVEVTYEDKPRGIRLLHPDRDLINIKDPIRYHVAAAGPKMRELTAELGMNWLNAQGPFGLLSDGVNGMNQAWTDAGRDTSTLRKTMTTAGCLLRDGEDFDSPRVRSILGGMVASTFRLWVDEEMRIGNDISAMIPPNFQEAMDQYRNLYRSLPDGQEHMYLHEGHCMFIRPEEESIITADLLDQLSLSGDRETMKRKLKQFEDNDIDELVISVTHGCDHDLEEWADYFSL